MPKNSKKPKTEVETLERKKPKKASKRDAMKTKNLVELVAIARKGSLSSASAIYELERRNVVGWQTMERRELFTMDREARSL